MQLSKNSKRIIIIVAIGVVLILCVYFFIKSIRKKVNMSVENNNVQAFLKAIRVKESSLDDTAFTLLVGGGHFKSFADHPYITGEFKGIRVGKDLTTAAGAFQITVSTWRIVKAALGLPDFSPKSQEKAAIWLLDTRRKALGDIIAGNFDKAIEKCRNEWQAFDYALKGKKGWYAKIKNTYVQHGGKFA